MECCPAALAAEESEAEGWKTVRPGSHGAGWNTVPTADGVPVACIAKRVQLGLDLPLAAPAVG